MDQWTCSLRRSLKTDVRFADTATVDNEFDIRITLLLKIRLLIPLMLRGHSAMTCMLRYPIVPLPEGGGAISERLLTR